MMTYNFTGKTFLIAGASSGIGQETAFRLASEGANLFLLGRHSTSLALTIDGCRSLMPTGEFTSIIVDLEQEAEVKERVLEINLLDGVVFAAGKIEPFPTAFLNMMKLDSIFHTNFYSAVMLIGALLKSKKIIKGGSVVFISSIASSFPHLGGALYSASKAALEAYMRNVALEYAHKQIRANAICPGMVKTPLFDRAIETASEEAMDKHLKKYPLGIGFPQDVAHLAAFLLSDQSRWLTGNSIYLDGGLHLGG